MSGIRIIGFVIRSVLMGMIAAVFLFIFFPELLKPITEPQLPVEPKPIITSYAEVLEKASDAVVNIRKFNIQEQQPTSNRLNVRVSGGSGVIISDLGYVVTNYHVVLQASELTVELKDGRTAIAQLVGFDAATDLAVLKIPLADVPYLIMSSNQRGSVGDIVFAIGYPFGAGQVSTMGMVSAIGEQFRLSEYEDFILADVITNPGNSGGALINANGDLLGIVSSRFSQAGISFAISTSLAMDVVEQIVTHGRVIRGWLGFSGRPPVDKAEVELYGESSYIISGISPNGPAAVAGLKLNDVLTKINGKTLTTIVDLQTAIASSKPGQKLTIEVIRDNKSLTLIAEASERPDSENISPSAINR